MKNNKAFYKIGSIAAVVSYVLLSQAYGQNLKPTNEPIFNTPQAKPNIHLVLDDSGSMNSYRDIWDANKQSKIKRSVALKYAFENLFYKYRDKAYLGVTFLRQGNDAQGMIRQPLSDLSTMTESDFRSKVINPLGQLILNAPGHTPMYAGVYETFKMFRGYPVMQGFHGNAWRNHHMVSIKPSPLGRNNDRYFPAVQLETPLRYRCQSNHLILMTDGDPYGYDVWGIPDEDIKPFAASNSFLGSRTNKHPFNGVELTYDISFEKSGIKNRQILGQQMASTDLRKAQKLIKKDGVWQTKLTDDAGRDWNDQLSVKMPINVHSVSLYVQKDSPIYTDLTAPSKGMNLGVEQGSNGSAEDLLTAFDTIFASIIRSTSSSFAKNDKTYADVLDGAPPIKNGKVDLSKVGAIRYDTIYNFRQKFGSLRAVVPYKTDEVLPDGKKKTNNTIIWDTNQTIKPNQGKYVTFLNTDNKGLEINELNSNATKTQFTKILKKDNPSATYDSKYIQWLTDYKNAANTGLRGRLNPMGSITNSDIQLVNKDVLHINVLPKMMSKKLMGELVNYLLYKAKFQPKNYVVIADNDGFINFINAERGLTGIHKGGERDTAYFPQLLVKKLPEITKPDTNATLVLEGKTRIADGKVYQPGIGNIYATVGLTSMGTGGQGIVGYRLFGASEQSVKDWSVSKKGTTNTNQAIMSQVTPLFEIDGADPTSGYDLGYTFSDFEFFNRIINKNGEDQGQIVAVFGNGMADKSKLYFIDAYTGEKLHSIELPGISAMAIAASVRNSPDNKGQVLERIYVGDYLGSLYRIDFKGDFVDDDKTQVTHLFQAPQHANKQYQSAITAKPLVIKNDKTGLFSIYFGTGVANNRERDRGDNAAVEHSVYGITDRNLTSSQSTATVANLKKGYGILPLLSVNNLKEGKISYKNASNIDYSETVTYDLDVTTPVIKPTEGSSGGRDGWYNRLIADGTKSGERLVQAPQYDSRNQAAVFATWGVSERNLPYEDNGLYDPCLADLAFGKTLSLDAATGGGGKTLRGNKGKTNDALGVPTGDAIGESPTSNATTDISQLEKIVQETLEELTGKDNSTHSTIKGSTGAVCTTSITGEVVCEEEERPPEVPLERGRISIQTLFSY